MSVLVLFLALLSAPLFAASPATAPQLDATSFSAQGTSAETLLHIPVLGRYALVSQASLGARLELVDRMAGSIATAGRESGVEASSGRIDSFLEPGEYKLRVTKPAAGTVTVSAQKYTTRNAGSGDLDVPVLYGRQTVTGELHDMELLSFWVKVDASDPTLLVAMEGRSLVDAALWKDGAWDTGLRPVARKYEIEPGNPLTTLEYNTRVDPGMYLLICVGGPRRVWAKESASDLFSITRGGRYLGSTGVTSVTFGQPGLEGFLVAGNAGWFQLEAGNNKDYMIAVSSNAAGASRFDYRRTAKIDAKSASWRVSIAGGAGGSTQWVMLQGPPGETVEVRWFAPASANREAATLGLDPGRTGTSYMASVLAGADGEESIDLTGLVVTTSGAGSAFRVGASDMQTVVVGAGAALHRRINLLSPLSFLLQVSDAGSYGIAEKAGSATARYSFLLLDDWLTRTRGVAAVEVKGAGSITLQAKLYVVTVQPGEAPAAGAGAGAAPVAGILDFAIVPPGGDPAAVLAAAPSVPANGLSWERLTASPGVSTSLLVGARGTIPMGVSLRALPVDLAEPVLIAVQPNDSVSFPFRNDAAGRVFSTNADVFTPQAVMVDNAPWAVDRDIAPGQHQLLVSNLTKSVQWCVIGIIRSTAMAPVDAPRTPADAGLPTFTEGAPLWRDFARGELATLLLQVTEPASYRVATSGRLAMSVTIRTALRTSLFNASQNADGRNAVITSYLRPGTYLVQVRTQGSSAGRAGMLLQRLPVTEAGVLTEGAVLRTTVPAGSLLKTDVRIDAVDDYRLECLGLGRSFSFRFEDADGWPIGQPVASGVLTTRLAPGTYHYVSAADEVQTRRLLSIALAPTAARTAYDLKAKLLAIEPNRTYAKTWVESDGRPEDVFTFAVPAQIHAALYVSPGMQYSVTDARGAVALSGTGGEVGEADLGQGAWRIAVKAVEKDNLKDYRLLLATSDLYDGASRALGAAPQAFPLSVGAAGTVELWSYGTQEMEALLLDTAGKTVASSEAIPDDWNFRLVASLAPGRYRLVLLAPGAAQAARLAATPTGAAASGSGAQSRPTFTSVPTMNPPGPGSPVVRVVSRPGITLAASSGALSQSLDVGAEVVSTVFTPKAAGLYRFDGTSDDPLSASVSRKGAVMATGTCPVFLPLSAGAAYDVRFWHAGAEKQKVALGIGQEKTAELALGAAEAALDVKESALKVTVTAASGFSVLPETSSVLYSAGAETAFAPVADECVGTAAGAGWIVRADGSPVGRVRVAPLVLDADSARAVRIGAVPQSFAVAVPAKTAAVIRTDNAGRFVGVSAAAAAAFKPDLYDWRGASVTSLTSAVGLRDGTFRGKLWDAAAPSAGLPDSRAGVSASFYPVASAAALAPGQRQQVTVAPQAAVSFALAAARQSVKVSLETGMAAFASAAAAGAAAGAGAPRGFLDAQDDSLTGLLDVEGGTVTVVNESRVPRLCTVESMTPQGQPAVTEASPFETNLGDQRTFTFAVAADKASRLYLWSAGQARPTGRFLREDDGRVSTGETISTDFGPVISFPAGRGVLQVTAEGALKVWAAKPEALRSAFVGKTVVSRTTVLAAAGVPLGQSAEAWSFSLAADAVITLGAQAGGVTAVYNRAGGLVAAAAGGTARTVLSSLKAGTYTVFTRPLAGGGQSGILKLLTLAPETLSAEGEGAPVLIGPGEKKLYRFEVKADGKVGAGIRTDRDDLGATLFDKAFLRLDTGSIFIRSLPVGAYYLLVESPGATVKFSPLVYGLDGSRTATPDDIIKSYSQE